VGRQRGGGLGVDGGQDRRLVRVRRDVLLYREPWSTRIEVAGTTRVKTARDGATTMRRIQPQMASPVAVAAGLSRSTVSVELAIHET
jgi:hypothetical protein